MTERTLYKNKQQKILLFFAAVFILSFFAVSFSGCGVFNKSLKSMSFKVDKITLAENETLKIDSSFINYNPSTVKDKSFTLESDNTDIITVSAANVIKAVGQGQATITAKIKNVKASCTVYVSEPKDISIITDGQLIQSISNLTNINLYADINSASSANRNVKWTVSNTSLGAKTIPAKEIFSFMPETFGKFTVKAQIEHRNGEIYFNTVDVLVYKNYIESPEFILESGNLIQESGNYGDVKFVVSYEDAADNPARVIEWRVNNEIVSSAKNSRQYIFRPSKAGVYHIECYIDGAKLGEREITAKGVLTPTNVWIDYDNCYPDVFIYWDENAGGMNYEVEIKNAYFTITELFRSDNDAYKSKFIKKSSDSDIIIGADITDIIGESQSYNMFNYSYSVRVRCLGNNGDFEYPKDNEGYSEVLTTKKLSSIAKEYLNTKIFGGHKNLYMADEDELIDVFADSFLFRSLPVLGSSSGDTRSFEVLCEFPVISEAYLHELILETYTKLHFTGKASILPSYNSNNVVKISITYTTDSLPSKRTDSESQLYKSGLNAIRPHVNYDTSKALERKSKGVLPIDSRQKEIAVENSEQLYYFVQSGYKPKFSAGVTSAKTLYNYAREVLYNIVTDEMNPVTKAHAIYDWLMWQVNYDHAATNYALNEAVKYEAYYLEGVFNNTRSYAVCDGLAKAYALLCNMEGIECIRITGLIVDENKTKDKWAGHAWNKIKIDNEWYIVDTTWGDSSFQFRGNGTDAHYYEMANHRYFMLTDKEVEQERFEDEFNTYPRSAVKPYNWYDNKFEHNNKEMDFYINSTVENAKAELKSFVDYMVSEITGGGQQYKRSYTAGGGSKYTSCDYVGFEIKVSPHLSALFSNNDADNNPIVAAFSEKGCSIGDSGRKIGTADNKDYYINYYYNQSAIYVYIFLYIPGFI